ncbi:MAG: transporter [Mediterranea sp.]|jgi:BASS family bile acid:Na+ symporter|nr:transporter [Mediterranea sp.]
MLKFLRNWALPVAMLVGAVGYPLFIRLSFLTPTLIFVMLLLTFSRISLKELKPKPLHLWLLTIQLVAAVVIYLLLRGVDVVLAQAAMVCVICPTATSAAVITAKLGGSAAGLTTYTLLINMVVAVVVPVMFPLIEPHPEVSFWAACSMILGKVFVLLICPFLLSLFLRRVLPKVHHTLLNLHELAFYLWAFALTIVTSQILSSLLNYAEDITIGILIAIATLVICCLQFFLGKTLGSIYNDRVSGGQALGQKNTILAIWMAHTYLDPLSAVGPGFYVIWQNMINSWQLWKKRKKECCTVRNLENL